MPQKQGWDGMGIMDGEGVNTYQKSHAMMWQKHIFQSRVRISGLEFHFHM